MMLLLRAKQSPYFTRFAAINSKAIRRVHKMHTRSGIKNIRQKFEKTVRVARPMLQGFVKARRGFQAV
jgi:hypothetical protein